MLFTREKNDTSNKNRERYFFIFNKRLYSYADTSIPLSLRGV